MLAELAAKTQSAGKEVNMRMMSLSLCRSQATVALEKSSACLTLPDYQLLELSGEVLKSHDAADQAEKLYGKEPALVDGFVVRGLATADVAEL